MELSSISIAITSLVGALFSPGAIFTTGVNGAWYDPSDFSTMFQDAAGTTPVTAVEQPVGLMLDKSKGLALGSELVTNGTFDSGITGWSGYGGSLISWDSASKQLQIDSGGIAYASATQVLSLQVGKTYRVTGRIYTENAASTVKIAIVNNAHNAVLVSGKVITSTTPADVSLVFTATETNSRIDLYRDTSSTTYKAYFDNISVRELPGNRAFNSSGNSANFPVLQQDGTGRYYLAFNGVNQWLQTNSIDFSYGDKMFVAAGVRKLSDAALGIVTELSADTNVNNGAIYFIAPAGTVSPSYAFASKGTVSIQPFSSGFAAPITNVVSGIGNISAPSATLRVNGAQIAQSTASQGTGNYGNYPLYIGARAGNSLWFNGRLYGLIVAGKQASASEIDSTEAWLNQKTGAY